MYTEEAKELQLDSAIKYYDFVHHPPPKKPRCPEYLKCNRDAKYIELGKLFLASTYILYTIYISKSTMFLHSL